MVFVFSGCGTGAYQIQMIPKDQKLKESELARDKGARDKIVVIDVDGALFNSRQDSWMRQGVNPVSEFLDKLDKAAADKSVKAVVLRINSPGGSVAAADMMYHSLGQFKEKKDVPVVAFMMDLACSGAYYLACGTDGMVAQPSTVTGSIGTIMQTVSIEGTMKKIGVKTVAIKSGELKDMASPLHELSDKERVVLQGIIDGFYEQFLGVVEQGRPGLEAEAIRTLADGRVYTAPQAKKAGLIDKVGYADTAIDWAKQMGGIEKAKVVMYHRPLWTKPNIYSDTQSHSGGPLVNIDLPEFLDAGRTQFLYLWQPEL
jgi:protease-4